MPRNAQNASALSPTALSAALTHGRAVASWSASAPWAALAASWKRRAERFGRHDASAAAVAEVFAVFAEEPARYAAAVEDVAAAHRAHGRNDVAAAILADLEERR
jgi:hypothetical protein